MSDGVGVDTNIWEYAFCQPRIAAGADLNREAKSFLDALLADADKPLFLSEYQACEVLEVLRKVGVPGDTRQAVYDLFRSDRCCVVPYSTRITEEAFSLSRASNIHIYDYLVALPLRGLVAVIYTADEHFGHPHFQAIARIENPLNWVACEGRGPRPKP